MYQLSKTTVPLLTIFILDDFEKKKTQNVERFEVIVILFLDKWKVIVDKQFSTANFDTDTCRCKFRAKSVARNIKHFRFGVVRVNLNLLRKDENFLNTGMTRDLSLV